MLRRSYALAILAALACAQPTVEPHKSTNAPRMHVLVQFSDMTMHPSVAQVKRGGSVAWINYAMSFDGVVSFPLEISESFTCSELRPLFSKAGDRLESIPIRGGSENVTLPCPLKPGEYEYRLNLFSGDSFGGMGAMYNPQRTLIGKIVVK